MQLAVTDTTYGECKERSYYLEKDKGKATAQSKQ